MFNKLYAFFKDNRKEIIIFIALMALFTIRLPYYVDSPGGTISLKKKLQIENTKEINGDISLVYVAERPGTIPSLLISLFSKDWDIIKKEDIELSNEDARDVEARGKVTLNQGINTAIVYAFKKAGKDIEILANKIYTVYVLENAKTDMKVGDQILMIDNQKISSREDIHDYIETLNVGDQVSIKVLNDGKEYIRSATIISEDGKKMVGIMSTIIYDYKLSQEVKYENKSSEMGSSGGFANTLYIYSSLIDEDIIKGRKIIGTGTIDSDGNIGEIGGLKYKLKAANLSGASIFFVPQDNCEEGNKLKKENKYDLNLVCIKTFDDAIDYLKK